MQLFYFPKSSGNTIELPSDESRHLVKVLRKKIGDIVHATDGEGNLITAKLLSENHRKVELEKLSEEKQRQRNYSFTLAISPVKNNDRLEWCIEKATEIGVTKIVPVLCEHAERRKIKYDRLERIIIAAMKQSNQFYKPILWEMVSLEQFFSDDSNDQQFIAHCEDDSNKTHLISSLEKEKSTSLLIGPEGDFTPKEISLALDNGFLPVSLGNTRLRTETAAVVGTSLVAAANAW